MDGSPARASVARHRRSGHGSQFLRCYIRQPVPGTSARSAPGNPGSFCARKGRHRYRRDHRGSRGHPDQSCRRTDARAVLYDRTALSVDRRWEFRELFNSSAVKCKDLASEETCTRTSANQQYLSDDREACRRGIGRCAASAQPIFEVPGEARQRTSVAVTHRGPAGHPQRLQSPPSVSETTCA